jgi:O-antigen/teichoic acid export membrane protein
MYVLVVLTMLSVITRLGLTQGLVQFVSKLTDDKEFEQRNSLITFVFLIVFTFAIVISILLYFNSNFIAVTLFNNQELASVFKIMSPILIIYSLIELTPGIFRGLKIVKYQVIGRDLLQSLIRLIIVFIMGYLGYELGGLITAYYLSMIVSLVYLVYKVYRLKLFEKIKREYISQYKEILLFSFPLLISGILHFSIGKIDIFMIGYFLESEQVGIYTIALKIGTLTNFLLFSFNSIFAPTITSLYYDNKLVKLKKLYQVITKWMLGINLSVFFLFLILSKEIMNVFGSEFVIGWLALILIMAGQVINAGVGSAGLINIMTGFPHSELYVSLVVFTVNIVLNYFLIPVYGIEGAAFASLISIGFTNLLRLFILYRRLEFLPYNKNYLTVIISAILALFVSYIFNSLIDVHYLLQILMVGIVFMSVAIFANFKLGIEEEDRMILRRIKNKLF